MSDQRNGGIVWTEHTWNPLRGCSRVSDGCVNCYAESMAARFCGEGQPYEGTINPETKRWSGKIKLVHEKLTEPLRWKRPRMVFVNSMSDLFHEEVPDEFIDQVFAVMALATQHTFQVLTKRPQRMLKYMLRYTDCATPLSAHAAWASDMANIFGGDDTDKEYDEIISSGWPLPNVWLGVTAENQQAADERIPLLLQTPAAVRWVSVEPMVGAVDLSRWFDLYQYEEGDCWRQRNLSRPLHSPDWIVCGGESGQHARPMHPDWARDMRDQCTAAGVPFLFKQWGEWAPQEHWPSEIQEHFDVQGLANDGMIRVGKKTSGRLLDGALYDEYPKVTP